ncbi:YuzD family protein [Paenalkalicoccus suaedae]|uniref:YuzD family protein n=1 Tax=Paenalkalicoccus suaedae TaxID=2592382 RepID=A0A859FKH3_9BACI|nr:YuzD family protein [Paenalkalicoccus suaedae]QKS73301.1 YuzD family protein [Paenalkalicoccus suaedae]
MHVKITVYGAEQKCASCIHLPSSKETMEWLEAAVTRKYPDYPIEFTYCDITMPQSEEEKMFAEKILEDEYFYPLVVLNGEVVAEGDPRLPNIYKKIEASA